MPRHSDITTSVLPREIHLRRTFDAPRELVWKVWTTPAHLAQWWGPRGFSTTTREHDLRPGGQWRFTMHGPDGRDYENLITYLEVRAPEFLSYKHGGDAGLEPVNFSVTASFTAQGDKTTLDMRMVFPSESVREFVMREYGALEGGQQTITRLGEHLDELRAAKASASAGAINPFKIARVFHAPRDLVFDAWIKREHLAKWWGPRHADADIKSFDARPGGVCHYRMASNDPSFPDMWGKLHFHEITPTTRLAFTTSFSNEQGGPGHHPLMPTWPKETHTLVTFSDHAGVGRGTLVEIVWTPVNPTPEELAMFNTHHDSMRNDWGGTLDKLTVHLKN